MTCDRCGAELTKGWLRSKYTGNVYCVNMTRCNAQAKRALLAAASQTSSGGARKASA